MDTAAQTGFYQSAADNLIALASEVMSFSDLAKGMASDSLSEWMGPPASYVLFVLRADALDVSYGTPEGFEALGIPYMAHIMPETSW